MPDQLRCGEHGRVPSYCVCVHVLDEQAPIAHYIVATRDEAGEVLCAQCSAEPTVEQMRVICCHCVDKIVADRRWW